MKTVSVRLSDAEYAELRRIAGGGTISNAIRSVFGFGLRSRGAPKSGHECGERCVRIRRLSSRMPTMTLQEIGDEMGVTREAIRLWLKRHGESKAHAGQKRRGWFCRTCNAVSVEEPKEHRAAHENPHGRLYERDAWLVAMYEAGWKTNDMAAYFDMPAPDIFPALRRSGVQPNRGGGRYVRPHAAWRQPWADDMVRDYLAGVSFQQLQSRYPIRRWNQVYDVLRRRGISARRSVSDQAA